MQYSKRLYDEVDNLDYFILDYSSDIIFSNGITTFMIGDTVYVNGEGDYRGKLSFIGEVHFAKGEFAGVVLDHPLGQW